MVTRVIDSPDEVSGAPMPEDEVAQTPAAPVLVPDGRFPDTRFDKLQTMGAPGGAGLMHRPRTSIAIQTGNPPRMEKGGIPDEPDEPRDPGQAPGGRRNGPPRRSGAQGGRPPRKPPPTSRGPRSTDDPEGQGDADALARQWQELSERIVQESPRLNLFQICDVLDELGKHDARLRPKQRLKTFSRDDDIPPRYPAIEAALDMLIDHQIVTHPQLGDEECLEIATELDRFKRYPAAVRGLLALMEKHIDPDKGIPIGMLEYNDFLTIAFDVLRYQPESKDTQQLCNQLTPYVAGQRDRYDAGPAAILLFYYALPALEHQLESPSGRALLQALMPYVERFFDETLRWGPFDGDTVGGFDVLDALRGLQNSSVVPGGELSAELDRILTSMGRAVTAQLLSPQHARRAMYTRFPSKKREQPGGQRVLANLIHHLRNHFELGSARQLAAIVHQWLGIDAQRFPLDSDQLANADYRDGAIGRLLVVDADPS